MQNALSVLCTIRNGKLHVFNPLAWRRGVRQFSDGAELALTLEEIGRRRSNAQNRFFHGPVIDAFERLGWQRQEAKDMLALLFIPHEITLPNGEIVRVPGHTSALTVEQFSTFVDACIQQAAEMGSVVFDLDQWHALRAGGGADADRALDRTRTRDGHSGPSLV